MLSNSNAFAQAIHFGAEINWLNTANIDDDNVDMELTIRDGGGQILHQVPMNFENRDNVISKWGTWLFVNSTSVSWEVEIWPAGDFLVSFIVDPDDVSWTEENFLNPGFVFDE